MKKSAMQTQIPDETSINGPMMVDKKMTAAERKKLMEIINKSNAKKVMQVAEKKIL
jgi:hypothetical protein